MAKERANVAEKRLEAEHKTRVAEITSYRLLIDAKASIFSRLAELGEIFVGALNPDGSTIRAARTRRRHDRGGSPSPMTRWRAA